MARFASDSCVRRGRGGIAALALGLVLPALGTARGGEAPAMLVATHDPALLSALDAAFSPRGVRVALADRPLRATSDDLGGGERAADVVWLCDVTPAAQPSPSSAAPAPTALCVRPHQGTVIIRRIAMTTPLSPEDAAALALSVQVALMPNPAPPRETVTRAAPPAERAHATGDGAHGLTLELGGGARGGPDETSFRASVAAVYAPGSLAHHLGFGAGVAGGPAVYGPATSVVRGPAPPTLLESVSTTDFTLRWFARAQNRVGPIWLQLDLGPEARVLSSVFTVPDRETEQRWRWALDGFVGAVVPFGRFFAGARAGGAYLLTGQRTWNNEALATVGAGWF